ncbi:MAG: DUF2723 domain-containing protein [Candidatus Hydrogenedentes bacterium]|nr:DUF2723 domain-containing protein [Candidatus Hydrogenedentota bacterium]
MRKIKFNLTKKSLTILNALSILVLTLSIYTATLAPTVTCEDSGELITAGYHLGVPHPPGYPTWCLLSHPFSYIPFGSIAWRFNLSSAFFACLTNLVVYLIILELSGGIHSVAIASSLIFAFSAEFWEQSVIAEVYTLNALLFALCVLVLLKWERSRKIRWLYLMGIIIGLGLGNHPTMFVLCPIFVGYVNWVSLRNKENTISIIIIITSSILTWLLTCTYLYIASKSNPPCDWGNPETIPNLIRHILRKQYQFMIFQYPRSLLRTIKQIYVFYTMAYEQFGSPLTIILVILGFLTLFLKNIRWGILFISICLTVGISATLVQNFNFDREWLSVMSVFGIPIYLCYSIVIGIFLSFIYSKTSKNVIKILFLICIFGLPLIAFIRNYNRNDLSNYWWGYEFGANILNSLEENSIVIPYTDHATFTMLYLQEVEGIRKDVKLGIKYGYFNLDIFGDAKGDMKKKYGEFPQSKDEPELIGWLIDNTDFPIYSEKEIKVKSKNKGKWVPAGIFYRFQRDKEEVIPSNTFWNRYKWSMNESNIKDVSSALIWLQIQWAKARDAYMIKNTKEARGLIEKSIEVYGEDDVILNNAGVLCARYGDYATAKIFFEKGLKINPQNRALINNLKRIKKYL